jgi:hypothetical protein
MTEGQEIALKTDGGIDALEKCIFDRIDPVLSNLNTLIARLGDAQTGVPPAVDAVRVSVENSKATFAQRNMTLAQASKTLAALIQRLMPFLWMRTKLCWAWSTTPRASIKRLSGSPATQQLMASTQKSAQGTSKEVTESLKQMQRVFGETVLLMEDMRRSTLGRWFVAPRSTGALGSPSAPQVPKAPGSVTP